MKRDTLKTFAGLLIIGVIVVATFLYGNAQRQSQLKHDQDVKKQQQATAADAKKASPSASAAPTTKPSAQANTAPVQSPTNNKLQSPGTPTPTPKPTSTPTPTPAVAGAQTVPVTGGSDLPDTGAPVAGLVGMVVILGSVVAMRRSKKSLFHAARTPR
jgi:cytoskeletal protein RodZ